MGRSSSCGKPKIRNVGKNIIPGVYTLHHPQECSHMFRGKPLHRVPENPNEIKPTVKIITNDLIRDIVIPSTSTSDVPGIWPKKEIDRLAKRSHVLTTKDRIQILEDEQSKKNRLANESEMRKYLLRNAQVKKEKGKFLNDIEMAEYKRTAHLLKRAAELQHENEFEVQNANSLILATKCQAIRDAQIAEKNLLKQQSSQEDSKLLKIQEEQAAKEYLEEQKRRDAEKQKQAAYTNAVLQQVREHEIAQLWEMERKEEEARMQNRILIQQQREADEQLKAKLAENQRAREEEKAVNDQLQKFQLMKKEEERIEDLRVREFLRKKAEREATLEEEKRLDAEAKQKRKDYLYERQRHALSLQTTGDEMSALRVQEEVERKWRAAEKEAARKQVITNEKLKKDRENQIMDLKRMQAMEMERDKVEFYKNIEVQKKLYEQDLDAEKRKKDAKLQYRAELLRQINDKEKQRIEERKLIFEDGAILRREQEAKEKEIKEYIKEKVEKLKDINFVPENLVKDIERQLKI